MHPDCLQDLAISTFVNFNGTSYFVELNKSREKVEKWNADHSKSDRVVRELQARVDDLTEAVGAKDSQLAVLKVRLQEADQLLSARTEALEALQSEKSRYFIISYFGILQTVVSLKKSR